jgi:transposase
MAREIIATVERRRKWPDEVKLRIMGEALEPGAAASAVADRNGVCRSLLYTWLRLAREGRLPGISLAAPPSKVPTSTRAVAPAPAVLPRASFVPVAVAPTVAAPPPEPAPTPRASSPHTACVPAAARRRAASIEIALTNGRILKADESIEPATLVRLIAALEGEAA